MNEDGNTQFGNIEDHRSDSLLYFPLAEFSWKFGNSVFTVDVHNYETVDDSCFSSHVVYLIKVSRGQRTWIVKRRFREFDELWSYLKEKYGSATNLPAFPSLPAKTCLIPLVDHESFLVARKLELRLFLDDLLKSLHIEKLLMDKKLLEFLQLSRFEEVKNAIQVQQATAAME